MKKIGIFLEISIVLIVFGCKKSPELETNHIPLFVGNVTVTVSEKQIDLKAAFTQLNSSNAEGCGFELSEKNGSKTTSYNLGVPSSNSFGIVIDTTFKESASNKIRAWIKVGSKVFYSGYSYFNGMGYPNPEITSLNKDYAYWGEMIIIKGKYFSNNINEILIKIDNMVVPVQYASSNEIYIKMPFIEKTGKVKLLINVASKLPLTDVEIENYKPEIYSTTKEVLTNGEISIKGKFRSEYQNLIIPVQNLDYSSSYWPYQVLKYTDDEIVVKSGAFEFCDSIYKINFQMQESDGYDKSIIETGFYAKRTGYWSRLNNTPFNSFDKAVACNGKGYVIQFQTYTSNFPFWMYNPLTDQWKKIASFPGKSRIDPVFVECNGFIYCGLGKINNTFYELLTDFWKYDPVTDAWSRCADLNFKSKDGVSIFGANFQNTIYVFSEWNNQKAIYHPSTNSWEISDCNVPRLFDYSRLLQNKGNYYFNGDVTYHYFYKYDVNTSTFENLYIPNWSGGSTFENKGRAFAKSYCLFSEIDFENNRVIDLPEYSDNIGLDSLGDELFVINDIPYFFYQPKGLSTVKIE